MRVISLKDKNVAVVSGYKIPVEVGHKTKSRLEVFLGSEEESLSSQEAKALKDIKGQQRTPANNEQDHNEDKHANNLQRKINLYPLIGINEWEVFSMNRHPLATPV